jgi:hypothetical protein
MSVFVTPFSSLLSFVFITPPPHVPLSFEEKKNHLPLFPSLTVTRISYRPYSCVSESLDVSYRRPHFLL